MHIIIYNGGGLTLPTFVYKLGEHLRKNGQEVTFMGKSSSLFSYKKEGIRWYPLPYTQNNFQLFLKAWLIFLQLVFTKPLQLRSIFKTLKKDYRENHQNKGRKSYIFHFIQLGACKLINADIIHNQWSPSLASLEPLFKNYPIVQSLWGILIELKPHINKNTADIYKKFYPKVNGFHSVTNQLICKARDFGANNSNIAITYTNVDSKRIDKATSKNFSFKPRGAINIISIGDFVWRKGHVFSLEAMRILKNKGINFQYKIIGKGDNTECKFHIEDLSLKEYVSLQNQTGHNQIFKEFEKADIFLLGSVQEGFATVVTEAMASNIPVIATSCSGMPEILEDKVNSWLIPPFDPHAIAEKIIEVMNTPQYEIRKITTNATYLVKQKLTWEIQIANYLKLYQNALIK